MSNVVVSLSGGKDSTYALHEALKEGLNVNHLLFINTGSKAHLTNRWILKLISEAISIPAVDADKELDAIRNVLKKLQATMLVSGVMTTPEHMDWYEELCSPIRVKHYAPLWGKDPLKALDEMMQLGFRMLIIEVNAAMGSSKQWLGKEIDTHILSEIKQLESKQKINPIGEWGEYHTIVLDCPVYKKKLVILESELVWENSKGYVVIKKAKLEPKP
ncbi:MAG: diphthine--ammonia ligase [Candidatus Bathyarchaeia archaeon]